MTVPRALSRGLLLKLKAQSQIISEQEGTIASLRAQLSREKQKTQVRPVRDRTPLPARRAPGAGR